MLASESGSMTATTRTSGYSKDQDENMNTEHCDQPTLDLSSKLVDIAPVVGITTIGNGELSVGGVGSAVTVGQVVDDNLHEVLLAAGPLEGLSIGEILAKFGSFGNDVEPGEGWDILNLQGLGLDGRVGDECGSSVDLSSVVWREVGSVANEWVARSNGSSGWGGASGGRGGRGGGRGDTGRGAGRSRASS